MIKIKSVQGILFNHISDKTINELSGLQLNQIREAMKEYAEQFIDLAAEEAKAWVSTNGEWTSSKVSAKVDKESILEIKKQIK